MGFIHRLQHAAARFVFGLGIGLALTSAYVIVSNGSALDAKGVKDTKATDIVMLDPVVVTISRERFDALHAEATQPTARVHPYGGGPQRV